MNILFICEEYPPGKSGGIGTMVRTLGREMVRQGHTVCVAGLYPHGYGGADYEEDEGVKVWRLRYHTDIGIIRNNFSSSDKFFRRLLKYSLLLQLDTLLSTGRLFRLIGRIIRENGIDLIEMPDWNTFFQDSFIPLHIPAFNAPLLVKFHGSYSYFQKELKLPLKNSVYTSEKALLTRAEALCSVSRYTADYTAALFNLTRPIEILYNSINLPALAPVTAGKQKKIIFTGSLIFKKGINSLLESWNIVARRHPDAILEIYGKGDITALKRLIDPVVLPSVHFKGHVQREVLFKELQQASAAVFPSYSECFAFAPLEAMAAGCAVVYTSRSSGAELITDRQNGLLIEPDDRKQIAEAIILLLENHALRDLLAAVGKKTVEERFAIQGSAVEHIAFYKKIIARFKHHKPQPVET